MIHPAAWPRRVNEPTAGRLRRPCRRESRRRRPDLGQHPTRTIRLLQVLQPVAARSASGAPRSDASEWGGPANRPVPPAAATYPFGRLFEVPTAPAHPGMCDPMCLTGQLRPAWPRILAQQPGQRASWRPGQVPAQRRLRVICDAHQCPARLHGSQRCMPCPIAPMRAEQGCSLGRRHRQHHGIKPLTVALASGLKLPTERPAVQAVNRK